MIYQKKLFRFHDFQSKNLNYFQFEIVHETFSQI